MRPPVDVMWCVAISRDPGRTFATVGAVKSVGLAAMLAACNFQASSAVITPADGSSTPGPGSDAGSGVDTPGPPPIDALVCFGRGVVRVCFDAAPTQAVTLPGSQNPLDTSVDTSCTVIVTQSGGPELCVIAGKTVTVSGSFAAIGARPLVLLGTDAVNVTNALDVSSTRGGRHGAGANAAACPAATTGKNDSGGGGGGAGGSFGTVGGSGGLGDRNNNLPPTGTAAGGTPGAAQATPPVLRGGCKGTSGGDGADTDAGHIGGAGGDGGGAVYLIAGATITISGSVFASGAGGSVAPGSAGFEQGGGGGGSGGMIVLDAPTIQVPGRIAANGGAGAGGGASNGGAPGDDGSTAMWDKRAQGGGGARNAGPNNDGGDGAPGSTFNAATSMDGGIGDAAGGGGGGGLGLVLTWGNVTGTMISPTPIGHP
jgi:hypothetical protein